MGILFVLFAAAMAVATFIENDFGSATAYNIVYNSVWFELIFMLLAVNMIGQMIIFKLYRREKMPVFLFHLSFVIMILGAGITRYFGWEGSIHLREGEERNTCISSEKYIGYTVNNSGGAIIDTYSQKFQLNSFPADEFKKRIAMNGKDYELVLAKIIPNAAEVIEDFPEGEPVISLIITKDMRSRQSITLKKGDLKNIEGITIGFDSSVPVDLNISVDSVSFFVSSKHELGEMNMMTHEVATATPGIPVTLHKMKVVTINDIKIIPWEMSFSGIVKAVAVDTKEQNTGQNASIFNIYNGQVSETICLWDRGEEYGTSAYCILGGNKISVNYGPKPTTLPFSLKLNDFILERYPGSNSPSGYKSDVVLIDREGNVKKPFMIYMNNILKYKGYRFYQSSFDQDEKGTVLSVNRDKAGMLVTYAGYMLLFLFIILSLFSKKSLFHNITAGYWQSNIRKTATVLVLMYVLSGFSVTNAQRLVPAKSVSEEFGKVLIQDQKGRTKPLFTLSNDILRKVARENKFEGLSSMQVFLGMYLDFDHWKDVPMIKISNNDLQRKLGIISKRASFSDIINLGDGYYKISDAVNTAYSKSPGERSKLDKEVMKIDERVNILFMIYKGDFLKLFPLKDGTHDWVSPQEAQVKAVGKDDSLYFKNIVPVLVNSIQTNNISATHQVCESISEYQTRFTEYDLPSKSRINAELLYYKLSIFERLFPFYATVGLVMLIWLIAMVIRGVKKKSLFVRVLSWLLFTGFLFHTFGFGLRWYIAGHSPMSNGYESMIFISWVTLLAGFLFSRKSSFALSATAVLGAMTLMVAHLSFMDPEITNLVPVLKSYWLTLHVSVITGSYGFLGLGAILGLITLILLTLSNDKNHDRISATIDELTVINFKTLTLGLYFLTIGTFLGAVWANESWGRYWGWDPKETWSLITIIIYSLVIHSRMITGMKDVFTFNLISLFALSSVLMTYFGVNYYLSGLHSYAAGDSIPVPSFIYIVVIMLTAVSYLAYVKYNRFNKMQGKEVSDKQ